MNIVVGGILVVTNMIIYLKDQKKGLIVYILMACSVPLSVFQGHKISYEILGFIGIFGCWVLMAIVKRRAVFRKIYFFPLSFMGIYSIATFISAIKHETGIYWTALFGCYRLMLLFVLFTQVQWERKLWKQFMDLYIIINGIFVTIQVVFPKVFPIFAKYYIKNEEWMSQLFYLTWGGRFARAFGTASTPSLLSYIAIVAFILYLRKFLVNQMQIMDYIIWGLAIICGASSATKAFFMGSILCVGGVLVICFWFSKLDKKKYIELKKNSIIMAVLMMLCIGAASIYMDFKGVMVLDYIKKSMNVVTALETRYDMSFVQDVVHKEVDSENERQEKEDVYVAPQTAMYQIEVLQSYEKLIGVGATTPYGELVQDSGWFEIIHNAGMIGMVMMVGWVACYVMASYRTRNIEMLLYEMMLYVLGLAICSIMQFLGILLMTWVYNTCYLLPCDVEEEKEHEENIVLH